MSEKLDRNHQPTDTDSPDNPYEHKVCGLTLVCSLAFLAICAWYLLSPQKEGWMLTVMAVTGGVFALAVLNFFRAAFGGRLCGSGK